MDDGVISWLLEDADPSLEPQVRRDLLGQSGPDLASAAAGIGARGWAKELLDRRGADGHWGRGAYGPKWTCTHYVLHELAQLEVPPDARSAESTRLLLSYPRGRDGGVNYAKTVDVADVCVNGMLLSIAARYLDPTACADSMAGLVDYLLSVTMTDGGWNCEYHSGAVKSSLHTTLAVVEGLLDYRSTGWRYRREEAEAAAAAGVELILSRCLFKSFKTGEAIRDEFFKYPFPARWKYDVLRCLDAFRRFGVVYDRRMDEALDRVSGARDKAGRWKAASQPGTVYFAMERDGSPGKWNTLRALRVLKAYGVE